VTGIVGIVAAWATAAWLVLLGVCLACVLLFVVSPRMREGTVKISFKGITLGTKLAPDVVAEVELSGFDAAAATYTFIHAQMADDPKTQRIKTTLQDELVAVAKRLAAEGKIKQDEIAAAIKDGIPAARPLAFGVLVVQPQWATVDLLVQGITTSRSGNEQYHALRAAIAAWKILTPDARKTLQEKTRTAPWIKDDNDRRKEAEKLLALPVS
jgi:hypothetical protein